MVSRPLARILRLRTLPVLAALFTFAPAAPALGASVTPTQFMASDGETNVVSAYYEPDLRPTEPLRIVDTGATLTPGAGCRTGVSVNEVICEAPGPNTIIGVNLGNGDDQFTWMTDAVPPRAPTNPTVLAAAGGLGTDRITGSPGRDDVVGGDGDNELNGGAGDDFLRDADGPSPIGDDSLSGGAGADELWVSGGEDELHGGDGNDTLRDRPDLDTDPGNDVYNGGAGDDQIRPWVTGGTNTVNGDEGDDVVFVGPDLAQPAGPGSPDQFVVDGGPGNDSLNSSTATASFDGGAGDDVVIAGGPGSVVAGGDGSDNLGFISPGNGSASGGDGADLLQGGESGDTLQGGAGLDAVHGNGGDDQLDGGTDDDSVKGGPGNDNIEGGAGNDQLIDFDGGIGDSGTDRFSGGDGDDSIISLDQPGTADFVACGEGVDDSIVDSLDAFSVDCEAITGAPRECPPTAVSCVVTVTFSANPAPSRPLMRSSAKAGKPIVFGSKRARLKGGKAKAVAVKLKQRKAKKVLGKRDSVRAKATVKTVMKLKSGKTKTKVTRSKIVLTR